VLEDQMPEEARVRVFITTALDATQREVRINRRTKVGELIPALVAAFGVPIVNASGKLLIFYLAIETLAPLSRSITLEDAGVVDGTRLSLTWHEGNESLSINLDPNKSLTPKTPLLAGSKFSQILSALAVTGDSQRGDTIDRPFRGNAEASDEADNQSNSKPSDGDTVDRPSHGNEKNSDGGNDYSNPEPSDAEQQEGRILIALNEFMLSLAERQKRLIEETMNEFEARRLLTIMDEKKSPEDDGYTVLVRPFFGRHSVEDQYTCHAFMIMPFGKDLTSVYLRCIKPFLEQSLNLTIKRGDDFSPPSSVMPDIWSAICNCSLIIADCTGHNANVFYEIGIAHTLGKDVILINQNDDVLPSNLRGIRVIIYQNDAEGLQTLRDELGKAINRILKRREIIDREEPER
jgi:WXG100 protein secretion system (Wss), protein YukD